MGSFIKSLHESDIGRSFDAFNAAAGAKISQAQDLNKNLNAGYQQLLSQQPKAAPDISDPAVQAAYRAQVMRTKSQTGMSSTFMGGNGAAFTDSFLGG